MDFYDCQAALVTHIRTQFESSEVPTVDILARELEEDGVAESIVLPAVFVMFRSGSLNPDRSEYEFPVVVVTESESLDRETSQRNNVQLASSVARFFLDNPIFSSAAGGRYQIQPTMTAGLYALNDRHCVIILHPTIADNSE